MNKACETCEYRRTMKNHMDIHFLDEKDCPSIKCDVKDNLKNKKKSKKKVK